MEGSKKSPQAIVVLGQSLHPDGTTPPTLTCRVRGAAALHASHPRALLIATGGDPAQTGRTEAAVMRSLLVQEGVPEELILVEEQSLTTLGNAWHVFDLLRERSITSILLVTSDFHLPRASVYFEAVLAYRCGRDDFFDIARHGTESGLDHSRPADVPVWDINQFTLKERLQQEREFLLSRTPHHFSSHLAGLLEEGSALPLPSQARIDQAVREVEVLLTLQGLDPVYQTGVITREDAPRRVRSGFLPFLEDEDMFKKKIAGKRVLFVRHARSAYQDDHRSFEERCRDTSLRDTCLSSEGRKQCAFLAGMLQRFGGPNAFDLLVASPLTRTMQTLALVFGGRHARDAVLLNLVAEQVDTWNDVGRPLEERSRAHGSQVDLPELRSFEWHESESNLCKIPTRWKEIDGRPQEGEDSLLMRIKYFWRWLAEQDAKHIVVVSHAKFLGRPGAKVGLLLPIIEERGSPFANLSTEYVEFA